MSNHDVVVKRLLSSINKLNRWVDIVFPELRQVFKDIKGKGAIATLRLFPTPIELATMQPMRLLPSVRIRSVFKYRKVET